MGDWLFALLAQDRFLQVTTVFVSLIGCAFSSYAVLDALWSFLMFKDAGINGHRRGVLRLHAVTHGGILVAQFGMAVTSVLAATLPPVPVAMYHGIPNGAWIVVVIAVRKVVRLVVCLVLLAVAAYKVRWLHRVNA